MTSWCQQLKHEGGQRLVEELRAYLPRKKAVPAKHAEVVQWTNNVHRTDYPRQVANGWLIGLGGGGIGVQDGGLPTA